MRSIQDRISEQLTQNIEDIESETPLSDGQRNEISEGLKRARKDFNKLITWFEFAEKIADIGLWEHDHTENNITWSAETSRIWGYDPQLTQPNFELYKKRIHPDDRARVVDAYQESQTSKERFYAVYRLKMPDDEIKFVESHGIHFYDDEDNILLTLGTNQNVTERELEKKEMEQSLEENQTVLDEIHHRVKNNLAVVAGTLQLQWLQEDDPEVVEKLQTSANRIKTIAGIHQQLYESDHLSNVSLGENIERLAANLISSMESDTQITLHANYDEVDLDIKKTLPCSLIANEVVTNAIKYAFPNAEEGEISIELTKNDDQISLKISDNGIGLPDDFNKKQDSLGMSLINTLSAQLEADYNFDSSDDGTVFSLLFTEN